MRPACVFANGPACQIEQLRDQLRGSWREGLRTVMVLPVHGLSAGEIAALLECHPSTAYRWISRFTGQK